VFGIVHGIIPTNQFSMLASEHTWRGDMEDDWVSVYRAALIELEQAQISGRIAHGQKAIIGGVERLTYVPGIRPEKNAIEDALRSLRALEQAEADLVRRAVARALDDLRSVGAE
jgi:hypothetical protein